VIHINVPVSTMPIAAASHKRSGVSAPADACATSAISHCVTNQNAIKLRTPAMITPRYNACMILPPSLVFTKEQPMIEVIIDTPPNANG